MPELLAAPLSRDVIDAVGPETLAYLQGQMSQDLNALVDGQSTWSLLLEPQGKITALLRVTRVSDDHFLLDTDVGFGEAVLARLTRFKLRSKCELTLTTVAGVAWRGDGAADIDTAGALIAADAGWFGIQSLDVLGPDVVVPDAAVTAEILESLRIQSGWPAMGNEMDESTIPAAAGIVNVAASFTKGCYTGQELVVRIDSRGNNTPKFLVKVVVMGDAAEGDEIVIEDAPVGVITSIVGRHALAYVKRGTEVPVNVTVGAVQGRLLPIERDALPEPSPTQGITSKVGFGRR